MNTQLKSILAKKLAKGNKANGFTLIELMVVVSIVGVLSAVGLPQLLKAQDRAKISAAQQEAVNYAKECSVSLLAGGSAPTVGDFPTVPSAQACSAGTDVTAVSDTTTPVTWTVTMVGGIPGIPSSNE